MSTDSNIKFYDHLLTLNTFEQLEAQIDANQKDFFEETYSQSVFNLHLLSKLALCKFFELSMLIKRKSKMNAELVAISKQVITLQKECKFKALVSKISQLKTHKTLNQEDIHRNIKQYVLQKLVGLYTCYNINDLAEIFELRREQTQKFIRDLGYKQEDVWVILEPRLLREENATRQKQALKNKLVQLTKLTKILERGCR